MRRALALASLAPFALAACQTAPAGSTSSAVVVGQTRDIARTVRPDRKTRLYVFVDYGGTSCEGDSSLVAAVLVQPSHGTVSIRPATVVPREFIHPDRMRCAGIQTSGSGVYYQPEPGFQGTDKITVASGHNRLTFNVTVK